MFNKISFFKSSFFKISFLIFVFSFFINTNITKADTYSIIKCDRPFFTSFCYNYVLNISTNKLTYKNGDTVNVSYSLDNQ